MEPDYHSVEKRPVVEGRMFTVIDETQGLAVCKIGIDLRDKLNLATDCTGETISVGNRLFRIVGVMEKRPDLSMLGQGGGGREDFTIFIPYRTGLKMRTDAWTWGIAEAKSAELVGRGAGGNKIFPAQGSAYKTGTGRHISH